MCKSSRCGQNDRCYLGWVHAGHCVTEKNECYYLRKRAAYRNRYKLTTVASGYKLPGDYKFLEIVPSPVVQSRDLGFWLLLVLLPSHSTTTTYFHNPPLCCCQPQLHPLPAECTSAFSQKQTVMPRDGVKKCQHF